MNTTTRVQILDETDCISHSTNTLGKGMNPIILPPTTGKIVGRTRFFSLGEATSLGEGKLWIQTCKTPLKNWPCVISYPSGGVGKLDHLLIEGFSHQCYLMVFHWSLNDSKSSQVFRTLRSILAVLYNGLHSCSNFQSL